MKKEDTNSPISNLSYQGGLLRTKMSIITQNNWSQRGSQYIAVPQEDNSNISPQKDTLLQTFNIFYK